ncbi:hypothetical protein AV530_010325 [Patagioenas fasciata monilis]|uniref:Uncharacterized protein n=1 Tax=Patagioenas fasciata monilis TaxID=372326 RepID=A0A1V4KEK6_PATFA|nr:hypothetical protein AV530_010325 [Patagioenas fasciata monilis]
MVAPRAGLPGAARDARPAGAAAPSRPEATREQRRPQAGSMAQPVFRTEGRPSKGSEHFSSGNVLLLTAFETERK